LLWICFAAHLSTTAYFTTFHSSVKGFRELLLDGFTILRMFFVDPGLGDPQNLAIWLFGYYWFAPPGETSLSHTTGWIIPRSIDLSRDFKTDFWCCLTINQFISMGWLE
jgi:hypothetical protein